LVGPDPFTFEVSMGRNLRLLYPQFGTRSRRELAPYGGSGERVREYASVRRFSTSHPMSSGSPFTEAATDAIAANPT
jgi:hypothetical protein